MEPSQSDFYARGLYPFPATNPGDLTFAQGTSKKQNMLSFLHDLITIVPSLGDVIHVLKKIGDGGWWEGEMYHCLEANPLFYYFVNLSYVQLNNFS